MKRKSPAKKALARKMVVPPSTLIASPAEAIRQAVKEGADLDKLEKLLALQERWDANQAKKAYHQAMAQFKANPPKIEKDKNVAYKEVRYSHASLANVCEKVNAELSKHGLSASWIPKQNNEGISITCKITHILGHSEEATLSAPADTSGSKNSIQAIGSTITYLQRYTLFSATGLAANDQDDDGKASEVEHISDDQAIHIRNLLADSGANVSRFLKYLEVEKIEDILKSDYTKAVNVLEAHQKKTK